MKLNEIMEKTYEDHKKQLQKKLQKECKRINTLERLEQYYIDKGFKTYYAINNKNSKEHLLMFHPNRNDSKIFIIHTDDHKMFDLGCFEVEDDYETSGLACYDVCDNNFERIVEKMKQVDVLAEKDRFSLFFDPASETYYCQSFKLFFEDQERAVMTCIRKNGYSLQN